MKKNVRIKYKLFAFISLFVLLFSLCSISSFAWHFNNDGNIVSDNVQPINDVQQNVDYGVTWSIENQILKLNGTSNGGFWYSIPNSSFTLSAGTYTIEWFTEYTGNNVGFGLRNSDSSLSELYQINNQRYKTFAISQETTFNIVVWWSTSGLVFDDVEIGSMVYTGTYSTDVDYEPYGMIYYSKENYDNALTNNYGLFSNCSSISLTLTPSNNNGDVIYDSWDNIFLLLSDKTYIHCVNGTFSYSNTSLSDDYLNGSSNYTVLWSFKFFGTFPKISMYNSFVASGYNLSYTLVNSSQNVLSYGSIINNDVVSFADYDNDFYGEFDLTTGYVGVAVSNTSLYFDNSYALAYNRGYNAGYNAGYDFAQSSYQSGYNDGVREAETNFNNGIYPNSNSYIAGYDAGHSAGVDESYQAGYSAGYAKARADTTWIDSSTANASDLIWTIGATPWESFKNIWNINFLGINLASVVTGLVTALVVIWLIKKVWK